MNIKKGKTYVDATLGAAGHTKEILVQGGKVIGFEVDPVSAEELTKGKLGGLTIVNENFTKLREVLREIEVGKVAGVLFDLGISSDQLERGDLGLSFQHDAPLDMRLDPSLGVTAADLVNALSEGELYELFSRYGEEHFARRLARAVVFSRRQEKITTSSQLASLVERTLPRYGKIHPATRVFMALRIAVNDEINNLRQGLAQAADCLEEGGRLVVISFHSLEDRQVKQFFLKRGDLKILTDKPVVPSEEETRDNPRARSAKLRVAEKVT